jgi:hypothetical protein
VHDLTLSEVQEQGRAQATAYASAQAGINSFRVQVLGELGGVARKVDALLQRPAAGPPETRNHTPHTQTP